MLVKEFRIILPMSVEEYQIAQLWSVANSSKLETGGGEGIEVLVNEPIEENNCYSQLPDGSRTFATGQYTHKIFHLSRKVPSIIRLFASESALQIEEKAWNSYPYCYTIIDNPGFMKDKFYVHIASWHKPGYGEIENVHGLDDDLLAQRQVDFIDIAGDEVSSGDYHADQDPSKFQSKKNGRGPFVGKEWWKRYNGPVMCAYKLVLGEFKWWGLQTRIERLIMNQERRIFLTFHRQVICWMDEYQGLNLDDIRNVEERTKEELNYKRTHGCLVGHTLTD